MDLDYLFSLLENKQYFLNRKNHFEDKGESVLPIKSLFGSIPLGIQLNEEDFQRKSNEIADKIIEYKDSAFWFTSCWTKDQTESLLMWKNYTTKMGARIKSNIDNFVASINTDRFKIVCGHISYDGYTSKPFDECIFSKENYYKEEHEVRFYFIPNDESDKSYRGEFISVLPEIMIDEVTLSPYINRTASKKIADLLKRDYNLNSVKLSKIELK